TRPATAITRSPRFGLSTRREHKLRQNNLPLILTKGTAKFFGTIRLAPTDNRLRTASHKLMPLRRSITPRHSPYRRSTMIAKQPLSVGLGQFDRVAGSKFGERAKYGIADWPSSCKA